MAKTSSVNVIVDYVDAVNKSSIADFKQDIAELSRALNDVGAGSVSVPFQTDKAEPVTIHFDMTRALPADVEIFDKLADTTVTLVETRNRIKANSVSNAVVVKKVPFATGLEIITREVFDGYVDEYGSISDMTGTARLDAKKKSLTITVDNAGENKAFPPKTFK